MSIGSNVLRKDAKAKAMGLAKYTDDFSMPGMRHAAYVRSTVAHAKVLSLDTKAALALTGVEAIFTAKDVPDFLFSTAGHPYNLDPTKLDVADRAILTDHVRYYGDEIAIVVAKDALTAKKAAHLVKVEYELLPVVTNADALLPKAPLIQPAVRPTSNLLGSHSFEVNKMTSGALSETISEALISVQGNYNTPTVQHCHMENQIAFAYMDDCEHIVIVSSTQIPHICRRIVGQALGWSWSKIRVIKPYIGGGFGNKQDVIVEPVVAFLTLKLGGVPVKLDLSREETILATRVRHAFAMHAEAKATATGQLVDYSLDVLSNTGAYASHGHGISAAGGSKVCYTYPKATYKFSAKTYYSNIPTGGAFRGYGSPQTAFAIECLLDDLAVALNMDPLELRLKNSGRVGDLSPFSKVPLPSLGVSLCLEKGQELFNWEQRKQACQDFNQQAKQTGSKLRRGIGVAAFSYGTGTYPHNVEAGSARMILNQDGTVNLMTGATEIGQGADTAFAQMAATTLGMDYTDILVVSNQDTDVSPFDTGAYASRQTYTCAPAIYDAASSLREKILAYASLITGHHISALTILGKAIVHSRSPEIVVMSIADLAMDSYYHVDRGGQLTAEASVKTRHNPPSFGASFAEIEVDLALCKIKINKLLNVHDAGKLINPALAAAQVQGGMAMGVGWALYEELIIDPKTGKVYNNNLLDYKFPTICDMPQLDTAFVETAEPSGPYGNKSLGEPPLLSPAPALRNALLHATGVAVNSIPMTPKALFKAFQQSGII